MIRFVLTVGALAASPLSAQQSPQDVFGDLFRAVRTTHIFPDGKTFVDAAPRRAPAAILADYHRANPRDPESLRAFVLANFMVPGINDRDPAALRQHGRALWPTLVHQPEAVVAGGSGLAMEAPQVVPGGRFREIYYWDSHFMMLGSPLMVNSRLSSCCFSVLQL